MSRKNGGGQSCKAGFALSDLGETTMPSQIQLYGRSWLPKPSDPAHSDEVTTQQNIELGVAGDGLRAPELGVERRPN